MSWVNKVDSEKSSTYNPVDFSRSGVNINAPGVSPYVVWGLAALVAIVYIKSRRKGK